MEEEKNLRSGGSSYPQHWKLNARQRASVPGVKKQKENEGKNPHIGTPVTKLLFISHWQTSLDVHLWFYSPHLISLPDLLHCW